MPKTPSSPQDHPLNLLVLGSISFELIKWVHHGMLLTILHPDAYGIVGTLFSILYLTVNLSGFSSEAALPAFLKTFIASGRNFKKTLGSMLLLQILFLCLGSVGAFLFYKTIFANQPYHFSLMMGAALIVSEGIRIFLRSFLHSIFLNRQTLFIDLAAMASYVSLVWIPYVVFHIPLSLNLVFIPYFATSIAALIGFLVLTYRFYHTLPREPLSLPSDLPVKILKTRFFHYLLRLSHYFFTGNFFIPLIAVRYGFAAAGILKFASYGAEALRGVIHTAIGFPSTAFFAQAKHASLSTKKEVFDKLSTSLNTLLYISGITIVMSAPLFLNAPLQLYKSPSFIFLPIFFLFLIVLEQWFTVYEKLYTAQEHIISFFSIKMFELLLFAMVLFGSSFFSIITTFLNLIMVRIITFFIIAANAYTQWNIKPHFKAKIPFIIIATLILTVFLTIHAFITKPVIAHTVHYYLHG